jgi:hypothetical protein
VRLESVIDVAEPRAGADRHDAVADGDLVHPADVEDDARGGGAPGEAVATGPHRELESFVAGERDRLGDIGRRGAQHHDLRTDVVEAPDRRPADGLVRVLAGDHDLACDRAPKVHGSRLRALSQAAPLSRLRV